MPQGYKIFYTSTAEQNITEKLMYIMQQYRDTALAERWYNRLRTLIQENLTAFLAKYSLYDVEPWSKTKRAAIAALFFYHKPLISRPENLRRLILRQKAKKNRSFQRNKRFNMVRPVRFERMAFGVGAVSFES